MSSNYIRLLNCNKNEMEMFIRSIVTKEASAYVDWHAWMSSDNPEVTYIGQAAHYKDEEGNSLPCRVLKETEEDGKVIRHIFVVGAKGKVERMALPKEKVVIRGEEDTRTEISEAEIDDILAAMNAAVEQEEAEARAKEEEEAFAVADAIADEIREDEEPTDDDTFERNLQSLRKKAAMGFDPENPEDAELPTIAFTAMKDWE